MRYQLPGLPELAHSGVTAFLPGLTRYAASGAQQYKDGAHGRPGTLAIPVRGSKVNRADDPTAIALMGGARSSDAPPAFWPNLYFDHPQPARYRPGAGMPIQAYDPVAPELTTMLPVPALDAGKALRTKSATLAMGVSPGGRRAPHQPPRVVRWGRRRKGNGLPVG